MRLSIGQVSQGEDTETDTAHWDDTGYEIHSRAWRRMALALAAILVLGCVGLLFSPAKRAGADTPIFGPGQVFASVGNSTVYTFDPVSGGYQTSLTDNSGGNDYTVGSAFDSQGNFYVTDDDGGGTGATPDNLSQVSEFAPDGTQVSTFPGLITPTSITFDNHGDMYVGQQLTNDIAEFAPDPTATLPTATAPAGWQRLPDIGPLVHDYGPGADWIDLSGNECTIYYTSEGTLIHTYNKCTATQGPDFNQVPFPSTQTLSTGPALNQAFELKVLANGNVLVADSSAVLELDPSGNVIPGGTFPCSSMPGCGGQLFAMSVDPSGTSFWTGDSASGNIYQINLASGAVMQTITGASGNLYGLSVDNQLEAATPPQQTAAVVQPTIAVQPVTGNFSTPTPVSAVLTNSSGQPITDEPVTLTLNGAESCTATTDNTGLATCIITPSEPSQSYTLTASFGGDTTATTTIISSTSSSTFTVTPDSSTVTYNGPTTAVNGQPITLTGTLTTNNPTSGTPLPTKVVTFTIGSGSTTQSCNATTDVNGNVSCTIASVAQPTTAVTVTTSFGGDAYDTTSSATTPLSVTEPTTLTVNTATSDYSDATTVSGVLTDSVSNKPIANEPVTFTLAGAETCTGTTDSTGTASCGITPGEQAGPYTLTGSFAGDTTLPLQLIPSTGSANFAVTLEETGITYTGPTSVFNSQNLTVAGVLTADSGATPVVGRTVSFVLGSGSTQQSCTGTTSATGAASCTITNVNQVVGPVPVTVSFTSDGYYQSATTTANVNVGPVQVGTVLTVAPATGDYSDATTVSATLIDTYTSAGAANEPVTIMLNGTQSCNGTTNASGVATCSITPNEPAGTYSLSASFAGDTTPLPHLEASTGSGTFVVTHEEAALTYTGTTSAVNGSSATLSGVLTTDDPAAGTPIAGRTVTFTLGSGTSAQTCNGTTGSTGAASCVIAKVNQTTSPVAATASFAGDAWYVRASATGSVVISTPTTLTVSATTGAYGQPTTVSGTLTNSVTGAPISGQPVTLTLNGTQTCTAVTNASGQASCSITPNEPAATYTVTGTYPDATNTSTILLASNGANSFVVTKAPTVLTYTGQTSVSDNQTLTLSSVLTTAGGTPIAGQTVVETLGTGRSAQSCTAVTNSAGVASCSVSVNQVYGSVAVTVSYGGNTYFQSSSSSNSERIGCGGGGGGGGGGGLPGGGCGGGGGSGGGCRPPCGGGGCGGGFGGYGSGGGGLGCA